MKSAYKSVDEYMASHPQGVQDILRQVRSAILKGAPAAKETISYGMPTYTLYRKRLLYFSAWKDHYSLYAATEAIVKAFRDELSMYTVGRGTIRFSLSQPVPSRLIERIARLRAQEIAGRDPH